MLRLLTMGIVLPATALTIIAAWAGAAVIPAVNAPEPATLVLLASGVVCILVMKRLRRRD